MSEAKPALMVVGAIGAPFGVRGWFKCRSDTAPPERILDHRIWWLDLRGEWRAFELQDSGRSAGQITVKLRGIETPEAAGEWRGASVAVARSELPARGDKEHYRADLLGLEVRSVSGVSLGRVQYFMDTPAHPIMVVGESPQVLIPAVPKHLRRVDLESGSIVVDWPIADE